MAAAGWRADIAGAGSNPRVGPDGSRLQQSRQLVRRLLLQLNSDLKGDADPTHLHISATGPTDIRHSAWK